MSQDENDSVSPRSPWDDQASLPSLLVAPLINPWFHPGLLSAFEGFFGMIFKSPLPQQTKWDVKIRFQANGVGRGLGVGQREGAPPSPSPPRLPSPPGLRRLRRRGAPGAGAGAPLPGRRMGGRVGAGGLGRLSSSPELLWAA